MKICALFSGGKDSVMAAYRSMQEHRLEVLLTIISHNPDSYMYHTSNINMAEYAAKAMEVPHISFTSTGKPSEEDADLKKALKHVKKMYGIDGVAAGAVASNYQYRIINEVCKQLNLKIYAPYWQRSHELLIKELIDEGFNALIVAVAAQGLDESWLCRSLNHETLEELKELEKKYCINIGGEGGDYESLVVDGPIYKKRIHLVECSKRWDGVRGELAIKKAELISK